ncbi:MAG: hypothetical protein WAW90_01820, partial [Minisyncoccia bacterium]
HPSRPVACPLDALVCPDGTAVARTGSSCTFPACLPPNVSLPDVSIAFVAPDGFMTSSLTNVASVIEYVSATSSTKARISIRRYAITASSTAFAIIKDTAIGGASGEPIAATSFSSVSFGDHRFTMVLIERFEGVVDTAYYLARASDVLRFDAIDSEVVGWTDPALNVGTLPAHRALQELLKTLP